jgi:hypothetical protein
LSFLDCLPKVRICIGEWFDVYIYLGVFVFANKSYYEIPGEAAKEINDMFK